MKISKIWVHGSYQMLSKSSGKEYWNKYKIKAIIDSLEDPKQKLLELRGIIEEAHKTNNEDIILDEVFSTPIIPKKNGARIEPNMEIRKKYAEAAAIQDHDTIHKLETIYNFQIC